MLLTSILLLLLGCMMAALGAVYCFNPDMIIRQANAGEEAPRIEKFAFTLENWDKKAVEAELKKLEEERAAELY